MVRLSLSAAAVFSLTAEAATFWPPPVSGPDGAYEDCPCAHNTGTESLDTVFPSRVQVQNGEVFVSLRHDTGLVPADYGSKRCNEWDDSGYTSAQCAEQVRPLWCEDKWCYVNSTSCKRHFKESSEFPGFFYSYYTCGFLDRFLSPASNPWSATRPLYAFALGYKAQLSPGADAKFLDMFLHFAALVFPRAGISLEKMRYRAQPSNATRRKFSSSYSACVHDVALGNNDLCIGDIWMTGERQAFGTAKFVQVASEPMMLLTSVESKEDDLWDLLTKPFSPFNWDLWLMVMSVVLATGLIMVLLEFHQNESDFPDRSLCNAFGKSMYLSVSSFVNAGTAYTSTTLSGRMLSVGYGLFILICIASFTANTASVLISKSLVQKAQTLESALDSSANVCYSSGMQTMLEAKYPRLKQLGIPMDTTVGGEFASAMKDGKCSYAIIGELWMDELWESGGHCDLTLVGSSILSFPTGYYVSEELEAYIAWAVSYERSLGSWASLQSQYSTKSNCVRSGDDERNSDNQERLNARNMLGACLVFVACLTLASIIRCAECFCCGLSESDLELENAMKADAEGFEHALEAVAKRASRSTHAAVECGETRNNISDRDTSCDHDDQTQASVISALSL